MNEFIIQSVIELAFTGFESCLGVSIPIKKTIAKKLATKVKDAIYKSQKNINKEIFDLCNELLDEKYAGYISFVVGAVHICLSDFIDDYKNKVNYDTIITASGMSNKEKAKNLSKSYVKIYRESNLNYCNKLLEAQLSEILEQCLDWIWKTSFENSEFRAALDKSIKEDLSIIKKQVLNPFSEFINSREHKKDYVSEFHYLNSAIKFHGRNDDIKYLDDFVQDENQFLYTIITGTGGMGKTKLMYHYMKIYDNSNKLKVLFLDKSNVFNLIQKNFSSYDYDKDLMFVFDYAGTMPKEIAFLMNSILDTKVKNKIRFVLLEREGVHDTKINNERQFNPRWYQIFKDELSGERDEFYFYRNESYSLLPLSRDDYKKIMDDVVKYKNSKFKNQKLLQDEDKEKILSKMEQLTCSKEMSENKLNTPLIILLLTDALLENHSINDMDEEKLMRYAIQRSLKYLKDVVCENDDKLYNQIKKLLVYTTAVNGWEMDKELPEPLNKVTKLIMDMDEYELSSKFGSFINKKDYYKIFNYNIDVSDISYDELSRLKEYGVKETIDVFEGLQPDIIGEWFVINYLSKMSTDIQRKKLINMFLAKPINLYYFLMRTIESYAKNNSLLKLIFEYKIIDMFPSDVSKLNLYSLLCEKNISDNEVNNKVYDILYDMYKCNSSSNLFNLLYLEWLVFQTCREKLIKCNDTFAQLRKVYEKIPEDEYPIRLYMIGLANLTRKQGLTERKKTVELLKELYEKIPEDEDAISSYMTGLASLTRKQGLTECKKTVKLLKELYEKIPEDEEAIESYMTGLVSLTSEQGLTECKKTVKLLKELYEKIPEDEFAIILYMTGLASLTSEQGLTEHKKTVELLKELYEKIPEDECAISLYMKGLTSLISEQELTECKKTVELLKELYEKIAEDEESIRLYMTGLVSLTSKQGLTECKKTVELLKELYEKIPEDECAISLYMIGLANLIAKQELTERKKTVELLKKLYKKIPENKYAIVFYMRGLAV